MQSSLGPVDVGATGWILTATVLVLVMTPAVALFYGGMLRRDNVLGILAQAFATIGVVTVVWIVIGFSLAFGDASRLHGGTEFLGLPDLDAGVPGAVGVPLLAFVGYQLMVAVFTPTLITGATVGRWRFGAYLLFVALWSVLVYAPVAHWVFAPTGWARRWGVLDFAGGTVVHVCAGAAALAMAVMLGRRRGWPEVDHRPHNVPLVVVGAALLWAGWLGLTGGAAGTADGVTAIAVFNTQAAAAAAGLAWTVTERLRFGKGTTIGAASGAVAGLVAVTPAAGYVTPLAAVVLGLLAGVLCEVLAGAKFWLRIDDSLDVVAVHLGGGLIGTVAVGLLATRGVNPDGADGLLVGGGYRLLGIQTVVALAVAAYSLVGTFLIGGLINRLIGNRVGTRDELAGLDLALHGESAYDLADPPSTAQVVPRMTR